MGGDQGSRAPEKQDDWWKEVWLKALVAGEGVARPFFRLHRLLPSDPRCKMCYMPFGGIGGMLYRLRGYAPSRKNPQMCNT